MAHRQYGRRSSQHIWTNADEPATAQQKRRAFQSREQSANLVGIIVGKRTQGGPQEQQQLRRSW